MGKAGKIVVSAATPKFKSRVARVRAQWADSGLECAKGKKGKKEGGS